MRLHALVPALALVPFTACGGGDRPSNAADNASAATPAPAAAAAPTGVSVFQRTCMTCHQANGLGIPNAFPPLARSPIANGDKGMLVRLVLHGLTGPVTVEGKRYNGVMPPWKGLSDAELAAVLTYVRSNFGNTSDAVSVEAVARERSATAARSTMWTMRELEGH